jgi:hypothetical protein
MGVCASAGKALAMAVSRHQRVPILFFVARRGEVFMG